MAKISTIKPYKFVNPNLITGMSGGQKGGATIIAAGKKITGPGGGSADVKAGRVTLLSVNRIGATIAAIGQTQQKIGHLLITESQIIQQNKDFRRKRKQYLRDQESERKNEQSLQAKEKPNKDIDKAADKKVKEKQSWFEQIFSPFKGIIEFAINVTVTQGVLRWIADPTNGSKIQVFVDTLASVFNFVFNIAYKSIDFFLTGVSNVFGDGSEQGFGRFKQVLGGLGQILIGIAGFKALKYLLNPFALVGDLIGLLDFFGKSPASSPTLPSTPDIPSGKTKPNVPNVPKKPKGFFAKAGDFGKNLWGNFKSWGSNVTKGMRDKLARSGEFLKDATKKAMKPIVDKAYKFLNDKGVIKMAKGLGDKAVGLIKKVPGYEKIANKVAKEGGEKMLGKIGGKAIPVIGGLVNLYFAFDRLKSGDKSGAALEALSAILDLSGLFGFLPGPALSMALDAYLFGRDFFPDIVKKENEIFGNLINSILGPIKGIKNGLPKLPMLAEGGLVTKPTIAGLGENGPELVVPLGKIGSLGGATGTLIGGMESALQRMGAAGEIARQVIGNDLKSAGQAFGVKPSAGAGGDTLGKSVMKAGRGVSLEAGDDISLFLGKDNVIITDKKKGSASTTTLRGQLANVLSSLIWLSNKDLKGGTSGSTGGGGPSGGDAGSIDTSGVEAATGSVVDKGAAIAKKLMSNLGITKEQAAAIAGNFAHESGGFIPGIREGGPFGRNSKPWPQGTVGKGYGWAQWTNSVPGDRYDKFIQSYGGDYNKIPTNEDNLKFAIQEMKTTNKLSSRFKKMTNVADAAVWFRANWERAGVHHDGPRIAYAKGILAKMASGGRLWKELHGIDQRTSQDTTTAKQAAKSAPDKKPQQFALGGNYKNGFLPDSALASIRGGGKLRKEVAPNFNRMWDDAKKAGHSLGLNSSYRSYEDQVATYKRYGSPRAAKPGSSPHSWGLAVDLNFSNAGYKWLKQNAKKYGFNQIPGLETNNPDGFEAWHWQVGSGRPDGASVSAPPSSSADTGTSSGGGENQDTSAQDDIKKMIEAFDKFAAPSAPKLNLAPASAGEGVSYAGAKPATNAFSGNASIKSTPTAASSGAAISSSSQQFQVQDAIDSSKATVLPIPINTTSNVQMMVGGAPQVFRSQAPITRGFG
jgi:Phage tail lysozyme/D-alanyl-D-alanine carboxypeptidase